jgi:synaptobrevin family protein YKT6
MKLLALKIYKWDAEKPVEVSSHMDLSSFSFFQRGTVKELITFGCRTVTAQIQKGSRQSVAMEQEVGICHVYVAPNGLAFALLSDKEYPMRVAFSMIAEVARTFTAKQGDAWAAKTDDCQMDFAEGDEMLTRFQNPAEADKIMKIEKDLEEVKGIVVKSMDDILKRGENIESLMNKSADLSQTSVQFYRTAKKNNQCCQAY